MDGHETRVGRWSRRRVIHAEPLSKDDARSPGLSRELTESGPGFAPDHDAGMNPPPPPAHDPLQRMLQWLTAHAGFPRSRLAASAEVMLCMAALAEAENASERRSNRLKGAGSYDRAAFLPLAAAGRPGRGDEGEGGRRGQRAVRHSRVGPHLDP